MTQRILIGRGTQDMLARDLSRRLMAIRRNLRFRLISAEWAKTTGRKAIENEFETLLKVSQNRVQYTLRRKVELPPEERARLERWRDEYVADWGRIVDDVGRAGGE